MISIVIPTYNRPDALARCLAGVAALTGVPDGLEVIVVNDGGEPSPGPVVARFGDRLDVVVLEPAHAGPAAARNAGAARARHPFVAFLDDDCVPAPGWVAALVERFAAAPGDAIGGRTLNALPANVFSSTSQLLIDYLYDHYNAGGARPTFLASNNLAFPRDELHAIGGFDPAFPRAAGEDRDLCDRWRRRGHRLTYAPEAVVHHAHALTLRSFWRQHFDYGRGAYAFRRARATREHGRVELEATSFYRNLLRAPFAPDAGARGRAPLLAAALAVSQLASAAGFLWERAQAWPGARADTLTNDRSAR